MLVPYHRIIAPDHVVHSANSKNCCVKILIGAVRQSSARNLKPNASFISFFARGDPFRAVVFPQWIWYVFVMASAQFPD